jgi:hypothetical protein
MLGVADELKLGGERAMVWHPGDRPARQGEGMTGGLVPYAEPHPVDRHLARAAKAKAPSKAKPRIRIENEHGEELVPDPDPNNGDEIPEDGMPF